MENATNVAGMCCSAASMRVLMSIINAGKQVQ